MKSVCHGMPVCKEENEIRSEDIKFEKPLCDLHFFTFSSS